MVSHIYIPNIGKVNAGPSEAEGQCHLVQFKASLIYMRPSHSCPNQQVKQSKKELGMMVYAYNTSTCMTKTGKPVSLMCAWVAWWENGRKEAFKGRWSHTFESFLRLQWEWINILLIRWVSHKRRTEGKDTDILLWKREERKLSKNQGMVGTPLHRGTNSVVAFGKVMKRQSSLWSEKTEVGNVTAAVVDALGLSPQKTARELMKHPSRAARKVVMWNLIPKLQRPEKLTSEPRPERWVSHP